jgi:3-hydroxy-9,10-secoandrosta-1,3,5(10)-triene-9,17-dione monooxygenase reductase component
VSTADTKQLRSVFGKFATGVTVVTFERDGEVLGMTVNSFSSVSLDPPMVLFCPALDCRFAEKAELGSHFTISILAHDQKDVCLHFAGRPSLDSAPWDEASEHPPAVVGSLAYLRCELEALHAHGDHYIAVGRVHDFKITSHEHPLMFYSGGYPGLV